MGPSTTTACALLIALSIGAVAVGDASALGQTTSLDREFTLAPGESASIEDTGIGVRFTSVRSDSRCPVDVNCIHAGSAQVRITVVCGESQRDHELQTGGAPVHDDDVTIALVNLQPYPHSTRATDPRDYRATLRVTR